MDKASFHDLISILPTFGVGVSFSQWNEHRKALIKNLNPDVMYLDFVMLQSIGFVGISASVEKELPGFTKRYREYQTAQAVLLQDLNKLYRKSGRDAQPFNDWL